MFITITLHFFFTLHQWNQIHNYKTVILDNPFKVRVSRSLSIQLQLAGSPVCFLNRALSRARPAIFFLLPALATLFSLYRMVRFTFCFVLAFPTNLRRKCAQTRYTIHRDSPLLFAFVHQIQLVFLEVRSLFYFADPANKIYYK